MAAQARQEARKATVFWPTWMMIVSGWIRPATTWFSKKIKLIYLATTSEMGRMMTEEFLLWMEVETLVWW